MSHDRGMAGGIVRAILRLSFSLMKELQQERNAVLAWQRVILTVEGSHRGTGTR